jgi:rubrerythrin
MSPHEVLDIALGMEKGLALFYHKAARESGDKDLADLLTKLAGFEDKHQHKLLALLKAFESTRETTQAPEQEAASVMEGGFAPDDFFEKNRSLMDSPADILSLSMMLETQALDLYIRFAGYVENEKSSNLLQQIADDEKAHLKALGEMIEKGHY